MTRTSLFQNINEACFFTHYFVVIFFINNQRTLKLSYGVASCYRKREYAQTAVCFESVSYTYIKPTIICLAFLVTFCRFFQDARPEWFLVSHMILDRNLKDSLRCSRLIMLRLTPTGFDSSVEATKTIICLNRDTTPSRVTLLHFVKLS